KNWMPLVLPAGGGAGRERLQFIYICDPTRVLDDHARTVTEAAPAIAAAHFSGGSQAIAFDRGWLVVGPAFHRKPSDEQRTYQHRFVWFDETKAIRRVSRPFFLSRKGVEFVAGLAWHPNGEHLLVSYGVADSESWVATVKADEVRPLLEDVSRLR